MAEQATMEAAAPPQDITTNESEPAPTDVYLAIPIGHIATLTQFTKELGLAASYLRTSRDPYGSLHATKVQAVKDFLSELAMVDLSSSQAPDVIELPD